MHCFIFCPVCDVISIYNNHINGRFYPRCPLPVAGQSRSGFPELRAWWPGTAFVQNLFVPKLRRAAPSPSRQFQDLSQPDPNYAEKRCAIMPSR